MDGSQRGDSQTAKLIWAIAPPAIILIGIIGNITTILVFVRKQRPSSTTLYLTCVAVGDLTVMLVVYPRWWFIYVFSTDIRQWNDVACKLHIFVTYCAGASSNTALVVVTIERIISVIIPYKTKLICTRRSARRTIGLAMAIILAVTSHLLYGYSLVDHLEVSKINSTNRSVNITIKFDIFDDKKLNITNEDNKFQKCTWMHNNSYAYFYENIFVWVNFIGTFVIPQVSFVVGGAIIVWKMTVSRKLHRRMKNASGLCSEARPIDSKSRQITVTLMLVNLVFLICTSPVQIFLLFRQYLIKENRMTALQEILWAVFNQLYYVNHAVNFVLYSISGRRFREDVKELYGCKRPQETRSNAEMPLCRIATMGSNVSLGVNNTYPSATTLTTVF